MKYLRRTLSVLAALFIIAAGIGLAAFMGSGSSKNTIPVTFLGGLALFPTLAQFAASVLAWAPAPSDHHRRRAIVGLSFSSISLFTWSILALVVIELSVRDGPLVMDWQRVILVLGLVLVLPLSAAANWYFFRLALLSPEIQHEA